MATQLHTSTKQQLDELDALLQKMLDPPAKPVAQPSYMTEGGGTAPPKAPQFPPASVAYGVPPAPAFAAETPTQAMPPQTPVPPNWNIDLNPRGGSSVLGQRSPLAEKLAPFMEAEQSKPAFLQVTPIDVNAVSQSAIEQLTIRRFDRGASLSGSYGGLTAIPLVRDFLGYSGLAMLAASATWIVLLWAGWF